MNDPKKNRFKIGMVFFLLITYISIIIADGAFFQPVNAQSSLTGTINGLITHSTNGKEISGASVELKRENEVVSSVLSSEEGQFTIIAPVGDYDLIVSKTGFKESLQEITILTNEISTFDFELSPILLENNANISTKRAGAQAAIFKESKDSFGFLSGVVVSETTELRIQGALVTLKNKADEIATDVTDRDGTFFIAAPSGEYDLFAEKGGFAKKRDIVLISAFNKTDHDIALLTNGEEPTPTPDSSPTPVPGSTPEVEECEGGGIPSRIRVSTRLLIMKPIRDRIIRIHVWKGRRKACVTDLKINCIRGCEKIEFEDTVTTNKEGLATLKISTLDSEPGIAVLSITAGNLERKVRVVIRPSVNALYNDLNQLDNLRNNGSE